MQRSKIISGVLGLIVVACAGVIFMDQNGMLGGQNATTGPTISPTKPTQPTKPSKPDDNSGYGGLK